MDAPGVLHHVMGRGIERKYIFWNNADRNDFLERLAALATDGAMYIYAWVLMPNHFHILCKTKNLPLSASMRKILTDLRSTDFGDGDFVNQISGLDNFVNKNLRLSGQRMDMEAVAEKVAGKYDISIEELASGSRRKQVAEARRALSRICVQKLGYSGADVARFLGVANSCVTRIISKGKMETIDDIDLSK